MKMATEQQAESGAKANIGIRNIGGVLSGSGSVLFFILIAYHLFFRDSLMSFLKERRAKEEVQIQARQHPEQYVADADINGRNLISWIRNSKQGLADSTRNDAAVSFVGKNVMLRGTVRAIDGEGLSFSDEIGVTLAIGAINVRFNVRGPLIGEVISWSEGEVHTMLGRVKRLGSRAEDAECDAEFVQ